jgi:hypothetical protein
VASFDASDTPTLLDLTALVARISETTSA